MLLVPVACLWFGTNAGPQLLGSDRHRRFGEDGAASPTEFCQVGAQAPRIMRVKSDGRVELRTSSNAAEFFVGEGSIGTVLQTGGTVTSDNTVRIGSESGGNGNYTISAGLSPRQTMAAEHLLSAVTEARASFA